jgi:predicted nucleic acid-binding protein
VATTYIDTSALVKRYVAEIGSAWVRRMVARPVQDMIYTAVLAEVEVRSALQRLVREGRLDTAQAHRLTQRVLQHFTRRYQLIRIT